MEIVSAVVLSGFVVAWFFRHSEGLTLWLLRAVLLALLIVAGAIGAMDSQPWPTAFQIAASHK
ncbi:MAG: hypothetical protein J0H19_12415 [Rhodospirillales bacterium]|nr:hypothetical protein [Rhodospirillales bacterium]